MTILTKINPANNPEFLIRLEERMATNKDTEAGVHELFRRGALRFMLHDGQKRIQHILDTTESKEFLVFCSRQFGKSFFGLVYALQFIANNPRTKAFVFAGTNKDAMDIVNDNLTVIQRLSPQGWLTRLKTERRWFMENGSQLRIGSLEEPDATRGRNCDLVIVEEGAAAVSSAQYSYAVSSVIGPMLLRSKNWRLINITTPSKDLNHSVHTELLPKLAAKNAVAHFTIFDNPQLSPAQIQEAQERCLTSEDWEREYMVKLVRSMTLTVVPEFEQAVHVVDTYEIPERAHWCIGLDLGGVKDKHGITVGFYDFENDKRVIWDELLLDINTSSEELVPQVQRLIDAIPKDHTYVVTADAPGQVRIDLLRLGLSTFLPRKQKGSFEAGVNFCRTLFKRDQITILSRCENLISALNFGQFNKQRSDFARTDALGHCDMIASLIYQCRHQRLDNPYPERYKLHKDKDYFERAKSTSKIESMLFG
jgi:hypothetical protein